MKKIQTIILFSILIFILYGCTEKEKISSGEEIMSLINKATEKTAKIQNLTIEANTLSGNNHMRVKASNYENGNIKRYLYERSSNEQGIDRTATSIFYNTSNTQVDYYSKVDNEKYKKDTIEKSSFENYYKGFYNQFFDYGISYFIFLNFDEDIIKDNKFKKNISFKKGDQVYINVTVEDDYSNEYSIKIKIIDGLIENIKVINLKTTKVIREVKISKCRIINLPKI